ncbi:MAG: aspartate--tRNA ligase [Chrysiogenales bacterium]|nr:MAG: aspartate--tRNA ligase [Chrysiogenales bacterium]
MFNNRSYCGELTLDHVGRSVELAGWVESNRNLGGIIFMRLRDVTGTVQFVVDSSLPADVRETADRARSEFVVSVAGTVRKRDEKNINRDQPTGQIEVCAEAITILSPSLVPPINVDAKETIGEDARLRYRFLDLRREEMRDALIKRHRAMMVARNYLSSNRFYEIETPILNKSTPEGARDFLVPSRINRGEFYALPQSPQLFKQILMISGFDRYFQIVKCFRDEDLRNDRQPEFTQIDMELSFMDTDGIMGIIESLLFEIVKAVTGKEVSQPFPRMSYRESVARFGTEAPDTRFGLEIVDCSDIFNDSGFNAFPAALAAGGAVKGIAVEGADISRKIIDRYTEQAKHTGARGLPMIRYNGESPEGGISKYITGPEMSELQKKFRLSGPSYIFFAADSESVVSATLGALRNMIARDRNLIDEDRLDFLWVTDFPLFEYSSEDRRYYSTHHPFTAPKEEYITMLDSMRPELANTVTAQAYDIVLNGVEIGGGSIRINDPDLQSRIFRLLGITPEEAEIKFSFLIDALKYGAPPHGGIALGLDRILMILLQKKSIRDVIAFPKTAKGQCLMSGAPSPVAAEQLEELNLKVTGD